MFDVNLIYIDGKYYDKSEAMVSVFDHGFLYGDGIFEGIRAYNNHVFKLREHIERLYKSAKAISLSIPITKEELIEATLETLRRNGITDGYIRLLVTRGTGDLGLDPRKCAQASIIIITEKNAPGHHPDTVKNGIKTIISSIRRDSIDSTSHEIKSQNYLNSILAKIEAIKLNADDAVMLDALGFVSEATTSNIFIVDSKQIFTPTTSSGILHGITRDTIMNLASGLKYKMIARSITPYELTISDEVFICGTGTGVVPVVQVRGVDIGDGIPGPVTLQIMNAYERLVKEPGEDGSPIGARTT